MKNLCVALMFVMLAFTTARAADEVQPAVWKSQEIDFRYSGFTSKYSCSGLRDTLRDVLLTLGARKDDLKLSYRTCGADPDRAAPFISINVKLASLQPVAEDKPNPIPAHWRQVDVGRAAKYERGDCELAEQVREELLPLFATRKLASRDGGCTPRNSPTASPVLSLEILIADPASE